MITAVTLNTSIDKAYFMEKTIENGTVMRVSSCRNSAGGKGLNVARAAKLCGAEVLVTGFVGGFNGQYLEYLLDRDGISHDFVKIAGETRSCINIIDPTYHSTEYLEPGCAITPFEEQTFLDRFPEIIGDAHVVTISGSIPKGMAADIYYRMVNMAKQQGKKALLDTSLEPLKHGLKALPTLIKPNKDELEALFQVKINGPEDVITYGKKLHDQGIPYVVISLGKEGALLFCNEGIYHGIPPKVEAVNPVGCGDTMLGAFAVAFDKDMSPKEALQYAVAVATASAMSPNTGDFSMETYEKIATQITIHTIKQSI